jgi:L-malate glycosyltransferase
MFTRDVWEAERKCPTTKMQGRIVVKARILIIQSQVKQYRVPFFEKLYAVLAEDDLALRVAYSDPSPPEACKSDNRDLSAGCCVKVPGYWAFGNRVLYQPLLRETASADLVIVEQANKLILNHFLVPLSVVGIKKVAFWGHARNLQSNGEGFSEWFKRRTLNLVDWWFAYTAATAAYLNSRGVPSEKITNVQNSTDTMELRRLVEGTDDGMLSAARRQFNLQENLPTGIYCGSLTANKLGLLLGALPLIKRLVPAFQLLIVGDGEEAEEVKNLAARERWVHYLGPRFDVEKAVLLRLSDVFMMPESAGLAILDAFAASLPFLTTRASNHGPEIEYIDEGVNGITAAYDALSYASMVARVLSDDYLRSRLHEGARRSSEEYTIEAMSGRFKDGVIKCLGMATGGMSSI